MGFFDLKANCSNCNKEVGLNRFKFSEGWLCPSCYKNCSTNIKMKINKCTLSDIKNDLEKVNQNKLALNSFNPTKKYGTYIEFDENRKQWLVPTGVFGNKKNSKVYNFEDIVDYELLEDNESITKGGLGKAVVGGVLFGGVGAVVGGVTAGRRNKKIVNSLKIKVTVNDFSQPTVYINLITAPTKVSSLLYKSNYKIAQDILSVFTLIMKQNESKDNEVENSCEIDSIFCRKCGNKMPSESLFCNKCGEKVL